ncbi:ferric reduction oxidase 2-like [Tripterygium wilfordii]|uniref:ferric reduction oxidase 2-like n=1 Tax=Tripterygium wilfordii TaxID=458696 RepID=UPI0018F7F019|nr:ferric reduction oxidase 2-like [Tripterygium wilfordii]
MDSRVVKKSSPEIEVVIRRAIWVLAMVVFMGSIMMWIMSPTQTYRQIWLLSIRSKTNSTYFGSQGATLLIFTFPILFIAVLGCVYLHLKGKRLNHQNMDSGEKVSLLGRWRRPMLVKGPLGIVSGVELAFFVMFMALLVWYLSTALHNRFEAITPQSAANKGQQVWQVKLSTAALVVGLVGNICLAFLFYPVARGSSVLPLFGLTSEGSIKYHIWLGHTVMALFTVHGVCFVIYWAVTHQISEMTKWAKTDISNVAGELALLAGLAMWATTFPGIRRKMFEVFFYTHHLYIVFIFFFIFHVGISYACIMLPGFYLFLVDRYLRFLQSRQRVRLVSARVLPGATIELNFSKSPSLKYNPTSTMFINVPGISKLQWHPFTITSNSSLESDKLSVVIKTEGKWSTKLYQILSSPSSIDRLDVSVEGPYGPASTHFLRHDTLVMVSGGSGITPFISIIRELIFLSVTNECKTPRVILICAFKNSSDLTMLDLLLPISGSQSSISNLELQIEAFVTREKEPTVDNHSKNVRTLWFKPLPTDAPVTAILGQNSWLWLGMILSTSFVIFLILLGIMNRYYIYPIDHNSNDVFPLSLRSFLNMLVICVGIGSAASAAVLWNKRQNVREANQIKNMEGATPSGTPASPYNADRELESVPSQGLVQSSNVHYGARPNLKRMILECGESSVGVVASGPRKMRQEVANICSSGLADNLHFESISFSW